MLEPPKNLVPRYLRFEVDERVLSDGSVLRPLDTGEVERLVGAIASRGIRAIAVSLLHAYRNPDHERQIGQVIARVAPAAQTSLSSEVVPEIKEYERTSTTVCNAYVKSLVRSVPVGGRAQAPGARCARAPHHVVIRRHRDGRHDRRFPIRLLESGPPRVRCRGGTWAARRPPRSPLVRYGRDDGKVCMIEGRKPLRTSQAESRSPRLPVQKGVGLPIKIPVTMIETGAGGGPSRAWTRWVYWGGADSAGARSGPRDATAAAATGPTVTDADLVPIDPGFLGGEMRARCSRRRRPQIWRKDCQADGLSVTHAAWGIHQIVNENMANAARIHAIDRGKNVRAFPIFAFTEPGRCTRSLLRRFCTRRRSSCRSVPASVRPSVP
jgi:N-methylhydantoinase A